MLERLGLDPGSCALLVSCGGGGDDSASVASDGNGQRARALSVPPGTPIPLDADVKGLFGAVQQMPVIPVHAVMTADGRVLT